MGCCASTLDENKPNPKKLENPLSKNGQFVVPCVSKSPPRPEEETVKEVLSETPKPKHKPRPELEPGIKPLTNGDDEVANELEPTKSKLLVSPKKPFLVQKLASLEQKMPIKEIRYTDPITPDEEISEVSEMCSLSESISTTTLDEQQQQHWGKDCANSGEIRQKRGVRSQGHNGNLRNSHNFGHLNSSNNSSSNNNSSSQNVQLSMNHGRSPIRRADPSPPRRRYPGPGSGQVGPRSDVVGENSARRSRSPAMRSNVGRSPSARRTGPSPGRVRMVHGSENSRKFEDEDIHVNGNGNRNEDGNGNRNEDGNGNEWDGPKESLENPLVSLECFIFL